MPVTFLDVHIVSNHAIRRQEQGDGMVNEKTEPNRMGNRVDS